VIAGTSLTAGWLSDSLAGDAGASQRQERWRRARGRAWSPGAKSKLAMHNRPIGIAVRRRAAELLQRSGVVMAPRAAELPVCSPVVNLSLEEAAASSWAQGLRRRSTAPEPLIVPSITRRAGALPETIEEEHRHLGAGLVAAGVRTAGGTGPLADEGVAGAFLLSWCRRARRGRRGTAGGARRRPRPGGR
jgi:hypothetical protein